LIQALSELTEPVEETAHRGFRGDASALCAADPVGDRRDNFLARLGQFPADQRAGKILIVAAWPGP
jgi:hypothetical protein